MIQMIDLSFICNDVYINHYQLNLGKYLSEVSIKAFPTSLQIALDLRESDFQLK